MNRRGKRATQDFVELGKKLQTVCRYLPQDIIDSTKDQSKQLYDYIELYNKNLTEQVRLRNIYPQLLTQWLEIREQKRLHPEVCNGMAEIIKNLFKNRPENYQSEILSSAENSDIINYSHESLFKNLNSDFSANATIFSDLINKLHVDLGSDQDVCEELKKALDGELDQHWMYHSPSAYKAWDGLINKNGYGLYNFCKQNVENVVKKDPWKDCVNGDHLRILILGAGANTKDSLIINSLNKRFTYYPIWIDLSYSMLINTLKEIRKSYKKYSVNNLKPLALIWNFTDFKNLKNEIECLLNKEYQFPERAAPYLIVLLGSTISNLSPNSPKNEKIFLQELSENLRPDDKLLLTCEFVPEDDGFKFEGYEKLNSPCNIYVEKMKKRYSSEEATQIVQTALRLIPFVDHLDSTKVDVHPVLEDDLGHRLLFLAKTAVTFKGGTNKIDVTTFTVTRRCRNQFLNHFKALNWERIDFVKNSGDPNVETWLLEYQGNKK